MISIYLASLILGGGLLAFSIVMGGDHDADHDLDMDHDVDFGGADVDVGGADVDMDVDADADADFDADHDVDHDLDHDAEANSEAAEAILSPLLPLLSLRFWTFFTAFFGLTGTLLTVLKLSASTPTLVASLGMGLSCGYSVAMLMRWLKKKQAVEQVIPERDYPLKPATVTLDCAPGEMGMVRLEVGGVSVDIEAEVDPDSPTFKRGQRVIVLSYDKGKVRVGPFDTGEGERRPDERRRREGAS